MTESTNSQDDIDAKLMAQQQYACFELEIVPEKRPPDMSLVDLVIQAVDNLRIRKMRPDKEHLFDALARYLSEDEDPEYVLDQALAAGKIVQIFYKNTISYRNPDRVTFKALGHIMPYDGINFVPEALNEIEATLKNLLEESKRRGLPGVTLKDLQDALWSNRRLLNYTEATLERALVKLPHYLVNPDGHIIRSVYNGQESSADAHSAHISLDQRNGSQHFDLNAKESNNNEQIDLHCNEAAAQEFLYAGSSKISASMPSSSTKMSLDLKMPSNSCDRVEEGDNQGMELDNPDDPECSREQASSQEALDDDDDDDDRDDGDDASDVSSSCKSSQTLSHSSEKRKNPPETPQRSRPVSLRKKIKKSLGPDYVDPNDPLIRYGKNNNNKRSLLASQCMERNQHMQHLQPKQHMRPGSSIDPSIPQSSSNKEASIIKIPFKHPRDWTVEEVVDYFEKAGFPKEDAQRFKDHQIDGLSLMLLKRYDILTGLAFKLGPALKIHAHVSQLQRYYHDSTYVKAVDMYYDTNIS